MVPWHGQPCAFASWSAVHVLIVRHKIRCLRDFPMQNVAQVWHLLNTRKFVSPKNLGISYSNGLHVYTLTSFTLIIPTALWQCLKLILPFDWWSSYYWRFYREHNIFTEVAVDHAVSWETLSCVSFPCCRVCCTSRTPAFRVFQLASRKISPVLSNGVK